MKRVACLLLLLLVPGVASAQRGTIHIHYSRSDCCYGNRFSLEPYAGETKDPFDVSPDDKHSTPLYGLRVAYRTGSRTRVLGNLAYAKSDNVSDYHTLTSYYVYDNTWVFTTAGGEFDVVPGRTSATLGLQGGAAWRRLDLNGQVGSPAGTPQPDRGFKATGVVIPSIMLRQRISTHMSVVGGVQDNIFNAFDGPAQHGVAVTAGMAFR